MIENSVCVAQLFPSQFQYFSAEFYILPETAVLLKTCQKTFLTIIDLNKLFDDPYTAIVREKMPKINIICHFSSGMPFKKFSDKVLLDNNVNYLLEKFFLHFLFACIFPQFKFFNAVFSILKTSNFNLLKMIYTWYVCCI